MILSARKPRRFVALVIEHWSTASWAALLLLLIVVPVLLLEDSERKVGVLLVSCRGVDAMSLMDRLRGSVPSDDVDLLVS